jgi:hypothetical protein
MLKWLTFVGSAILVVAVVLVARYDKFHDTEGKGYDIKCTQSSDPSATMGSLVCTAEHSQKAKSGQYDPLWWHIFFTWPEGITALLLMLTLGAITWQAWETRKAAESSLKLFALQKAQMRQSVEVCDLLGSPPKFVQPNVSQVRVGVSFGIRNPTEMLLTLKSVRANCGTMGVPNMSSISQPMNYALARGNNYPFKLNIPIDGSDLEALKAGELRLVLTVDIGFLDAFEDFRDQSLGYKALCSLNKCEFSVSQSTHNH